MKAHNMITMKHLSIKLIRSAISQKSTSTRKGLFLVTIILMLLILVPCTVYIFRPTPPTQTFQPEGIQIGETLPAGHRDVPSTGITQDSITNHGTIYEVRELARGN